MVDPVQYQNEERFRMLSAAMQESQRLMQEDRARRDAEAMREEIIKIHSVLFDKAQAYTTLIFTLGYAGFFTLWNNTKDRLPTRVTALAAILVLFSLLVFLAWEVYLMHLRGQDNQDIMTVLESGGADLMQKLEVAKANAARRKLQLGKVGVWVQWLTTYPGFAGALILMGALVPVLFR